MKALCNLLKLLCLKPVPPRSLKFPSRSLSDSNSEVCTAFGLNFKLFLAFSQMQSLCFLGMRINFSNKFLKILILDENTCSVTYNMTDCFHGFYCESIKGAFMRLECSAYLELGFVGLILFRLTLPEHLFKILWGSSPVLSWLIPVSLILLRVREFKFPHLVFSQVLKIGSCPRKILMWVVFFFFFSLFGL